MQVVSILLTPSASFTTTGSGGCDSTAAGIASIGLSGGATLVAGSCITIESRDGPAHQNAAFLFGNGSLGIDLSALGAPGCLLQPTQPYASLARMSDATGTTEVGVSIGPAVAAGRTVDVQCVFLNPGINALGLSTSDSATGIVAPI